MRSGFDRLTRDNITRITCSPIDRVEDASAGWFQLVSVRALSAVTGSSGCPANQLATIAVVFSRQANYATADTNRNGKQPEWIESTGNHNDRALPVGVLESRSVESAPRG
jgi:hypothetical protein